MSGDQQTVFDEDSESSLLSESSCLTAESSASNLNELGSGSEYSDDGNGQSNRRSKIGDYLSLVRFSHTIFAMPFAILATSWAIWLSAQEAEFSGWSIFKQGTGIILAMVFARTFAMAWNRLVDADIDAENPRTASRHIPAGLLSANSVLAFAVVCAIGFIASTLLFLPNWLPLAFSFPTLAWLAGYSHAKRFTFLAHLWLGIALALAPICVWIAIRGEFVLTDLADLMPVVCLSGGVLLWVTGFDVIYACQDFDFDRAAGLHSIPAKFGIAGALRIAGGCHLVVPIVWSSMILLCPRMALGWVWGGSMIGIAMLLIRQHWIVKPNDLTRINEAFFTLNATISLLVLVAGIIEIAAL